MPALPPPRLIPSIERLRRHPRAAALEQRYGRDAVVEALRLETSGLRALFTTTRARAVEDENPRQATADRLPADPEQATVRVLEGAERRLAAQFAASLRPVINATGVLVHTNLGRAPLPAAALRHVATTCSGYVNLEYDLAAGARGRRDVHAETLLTRLTGAEAAVVVNNNAAATLLMLAALARGREVLISRGELVEIGGGFRVPDVMAQSGAVLREVGTTNRTRVADYAAAIGPQTAMILRVHPSNFRILGFTERPAAPDLAALAHDHGLPLAEDIGSGYLAATAAASGGALGDEPRVRDSLRDGVDILCFSGDKLLGGPQAGIVAGRQDLVTIVRRHPLMRALRVDKLTYAALEATLLAWLAGRATTEVPIARMLALSRDAIAARAERLAARLSAAPGVRASLRDGVSTVGGGSAPGATLPTCLIVLERDGFSADALERWLRGLPTPIIARIDGDRVVLDLRTVSDEEEGAIWRGIGGK